MSRFWVVPSIVTVWYCRFAVVSVMRPAVARVRPAYCARRDAVPAGGVARAGPEAAAVGGTDVPVPHPVEHLRAGRVGGGGGVAEAHLLAGAEHHHELLLHPGVGGAGGDHDRRGDRQTAGAEDRTRGHLPARLVRRGQVKAPDMALDVARIEVIGDVVTVEVRRRDEGDAVGAGGAADAGAQVVELRTLGARIRVQRHDEDTGIARSAPQAVAEDHRPAPVVQAAHLRRAIGIAQALAAGGVADAGDGAVVPLAHDQARGIGLGEVGGVGHVERVQRRAAGTQATDDPGVPLAVVEHIACARGGVDVVLVTVLRIGVVNRHVGEVGRVRMDQVAARAAERDARHVSDHLQAVVVGEAARARGGRTGAGARVIGAAAEAVQETIVGADVDHLRAIELRARVGRVGLRARGTLERGGGAIEAIRPVRRVGRTGSPDPGRAR